MRGKQQLTLHKAQNARITPAGAGKTLPHARILGLCEDHPRRCGENSCSSVAMGKPSGSPPQVRGKLLSRSWAVIQYRITPAGAGKTSRRRVSPQDAKDHPRRCGENSISLSSRTTKVGSPPQVRGKLGGAYVRLMSTRITPAGAGKTTQRLFFVGLTIKSPPQVRGKQH